MKSFARNCFICLIGIFFALFHLNNVLADNINNELLYATSNAMFVTQLVPKIMIQDKSLGTNDATLSFNSEEEYFEDFKNNFYKQITSDAIYEIKCLDSDLERGMLSVEITGTYRNILGTEKTVHTTKTSVVDVLNKYQKLTPEKVKSVKRLYDVGGEAKLSDEDVIVFNEIECYVLQIDEANNKAQLITKNMYDVRFDTRPNDEIHYKDSTLAEFMYNFYMDELFADKRILPTLVKSYYGTEALDIDRNSSVSSQYVFALDGKEAKAKIYKFSRSFNSDVYTEGGKKCIGFWTTGTYYKNGKNNCMCVSKINTENTPFINYASPTRADIAARPSFWISLDAALYE